MRIINPVQGREPLQPLPAVQRPLTPPESQRHPSKFGGMARNEPHSLPPKEGKLQVATREEIDLYDDGEQVEYYDFEDDGQDAVGSSTVKMSDRQTRSQDPQPSVSGWQVTNVPPLRPSSPSKPPGHARSGSQASTPAQSRYTKSEVSVIPVRSSTTSTVVSPPSPVRSSSSAVPPRPPPKSSPKKYDALEDILLPALDEVDLILSPLIW